MKRIILICICFLLLCSPAFSQGEVTYTQRLFKLWTLNPSYMGGDNNIRADLSYKRMWEGMEGAPQQTGLVARTPIGFYNLGAGLNTNFEKIGYRTNSRVSVTGDVDIQLTQSSYLSLGLSLGADMRRYNSEVMTSSETAATRLSNYNRNDFVEGFGLTFRTGGLMLGGGNCFIGRSSEGVNNYVSVYGHASYEINLNKDFTMTPAVLVDYSNDFGTIVDIGAICYYQTYGGLGLIYRPDRLVAINAEVNILSYLTLTYSYDINVGKLSHLGKGAHEISLGFKMERFWKK